MSQITRCPSCLTSFKVVADQLRISEGWVRCGQCKEVFDASMHLLPAGPAPLLADVSLTDIRPPPAARKADPERAWGESPAPSPSTGVPSTGARPIASDGPAFQLFPPSLPGLVPEAPQEVAARSDLPETPLRTNVLEVPHPTVPAFLSAVGGAVTSGEELRLTRLTPFAWRPEPPPALPATSPVDALVSGGLTLPGVVDAPAAPNPAPAGYDVPFAALRDAEGSAPESAAVAARPPLEYPALDLPAPSERVRSVKPERTAPAAFSVTDEVSHPTPLPPLDYLQQPAAPEPEPMALVEDRSPAALLAAPRRKASQPAPGLDEDSDSESVKPGQEVSFVVAARRKAFWRKPLVRAVLAAIALVSIGGLALQVAVQERDRLAATNARTKPWLAGLCASLHCDIAPQRQIADVVIDSSSFSKARGDSYQLALTMKSKAAIPLAMPAVELTLTDAQDQPVLRRVLLPTDLGAPTELPARGEWSASVSVIVTTGGARVTGYRVLAFYP